MRRVVLSGGWWRRTLGVIALTAVSCLMPSASFGQVGAEQRRIDLAADDLSSEVVADERIVRLTGNVRLRQETTNVRADRAIQYTARDEILFESNVSIDDQADTLRADLVRYFRPSKTGRASGRVELSDGEVVVRAPAAFHDVDLHYTRFENGVELVDSLTTLISDHGEYWSDEKRAMFVGNVRLEELNSVTTSDSVSFLRDESIADATGNVTVRRVELGSDSDSSIVWLFGQLAHNESRNDYSAVQGNALMVRIRQDSVSSDTTALKADRLTSRKTGDVETMTGAGTVAIWRDKMSAVADSIRVRRVRNSEDVDRETVWLYRSPVLWFENTQVSGDSIRITIVAGELDSLFVDGSAFIAQEDTVISKIQQVSGPTLRGALSRDQRTIRIGKGADAIYFERDGSELRGALRSHSDFVLMEFEGDTLRQVVALKDIDGMFYDRDIVPPSLRLDGLVWRPDLRPTRDLFATDPRYRNVNKPSRE